MRAVLDIFQAEAEQVILSLDLLTDDNAYEKAIHFLRSGALNLGLLSLASEAESMRHIPKPRRAAAAQNLKRTLDASFDKLNPFFITAA
ncbi:hypothetical protein [Jannaschia formosa]|uniref:hypothetical protein n=1 Tax=Jannaschia formosa TaxID=2259592 RepID=UPI001430B302|nr:hypothetical protein [Jannaschia formosa]